jgi:hypothetical protein
MSVSNSIENISELAEIHTSQNNFSPFFLVPKILIINHENSSPLLHELTYDRRLLS